MFYKDILGTLEKLNFAEIISTNLNDDFVHQRIDALRKFKASNAEYVLFLNSSVIIHNSTTLKTLVTQDQNIMAPMIRKNIYRPSMKQICNQIGYEESLIFDVKFPHIMPSNTWNNDRYYVCKNLLFLTQILSLFIQIYNVATWSVLY